jgi:hypothetical protein
VHCNVFFIGIFIRFRITDANIDVVLNIFYPILIFICPGSTFWKSVCNYEKSSLFWSMLIIEGSVKILSECYRDHWFGYLPCFVYPFFVVFNFCSNSAILSSWLSNISSCPSFVFFYSSHSDSLSSSFFYCSSHISSCFSFLFFYYSTTDWYSWQFILSLRFFIVCAMSLIF